MLLSDYLEVSAEELPMFNVNVPNDTNMVIDPTVLIIRDFEYFPTVSAADRLYDFFNTLIDLYNDGNFSGISNILNEVHEINDTYLGESSISNHAQGKGPDLGSLRDYIGNIVNMVGDVGGRPRVDAKALFVIFSLCTPNFGKDGFSDLLTNVLYCDFSEYTHNVLNVLGRGNLFHENLGEGPDQHQYWNIDTHMWEDFVGSAVINTYPTIFVPKEAVQHTYTYTALKFIMAIPVVAEQHRNQGNMTKKDAYKRIREANPGISVKQLAFNIIRENPNNLVDYLNRILV